MLLSLACANKGFVAKQSFVDSLIAKGYSRAKAYRVIALLRKHVLFKQRGPNLIVKGKQKLRTDKSRTAICFDAKDIETVESFNRNILLQTALRIQAAFRYAFRKANQRKQSFKLTDEVETKYLSTNKIGCSFSKMASELGISKTYSHSLLRSLQSKNTKLLHVLSYKEFVRKGLKNLVISMPEKYTWRLKNKLIYVSLKLSSSYSVYNRNTVNRT